MNNPKRALARPLAAKYLKDHGCPGSTPGGLARLGSVGGGPVFFKKSGRAFYYEDDLRAFVEASVGPRLLKASQPVIAPDAAEAARLATQAAEAARKAARDATEAAKIATARASAARKAAFAAAESHP